MQLAEGKLFLCALVPVQVRLALVLSAPASGSSRGKEGNCAWVRDSERQRGLPPALASPGLGDFFGDLLQAGLRERLSGAVIYASQHITVQKQGKSTSCL